MSESDFLDEFTSSKGSSFFMTSIGYCGIVWRGINIVGVQLPEIEGLAHTRARLAKLFPKVEEKPPPPFVRGVMKRIVALLNGEPDDLLDVTLDMSGLPLFNRKVYEVTRAILPGQTLTYGDIAKMLGEPGAARAVGQALGRNPFAPVVPCHRVLAAGAGLGGFSAGGGATTKLRMLQIEGAKVAAQKNLFDGGT